MVVLLQVRVRTKEKKKNLHHFCEMMSLMLQRIIHSIFIFMVFEGLSWLQDQRHQILVVVSAQQKCLQDNYIVRSFHWLLHSLCSMRIEQAGILPDTKKCWMATSILSVAIAASCTCIWDKCQTMQWAGVVKELAILVPAKNKKLTFLNLWQEFLLGIICLYD